MTESMDEAPAGSAAAVHAACPAWCVSRHGALLGEEDWVHAGEPLRITDEVLAHLCMSVDPATGETDGPFVVVGWTQYTPEEAEVLAASLASIARAAHQRTPTGLQGLPAVVDPQLAGTVET